jgi:thiamine-phosphate pyrophosphorylase
MKPLADCRLYGFIDSAYLNARSPEALAKALCGGGADLIQYRAKGRPADEVRRCAESLLPITEAANVGLVVNDYWDLACALGAPVCHLGQEDFFDAGFTHKRDLPSGADGFQPLLGLSTHAPDQAARAIAAGADYIAIGPVFPTGTKPTAKAVTLEYVKWAAANVTVPWFAIGGINLTNIDQVLDAGASRKLNREVTIIWIWI